MNDHFAAFSFVDRITELEPGRHARGTFAIPATIPDFPACLVAEAVGQLAAWVAMAHIEFRGRPVAALANETRFHRAVHPGETLRLAVDIDSCDDDAVAYRGTADVGGVRVIELIDCLGPMLPVAEFDDPLALAERFELLCGPGAVPGRFGGVAVPRVQRESNVPGEMSVGALQVPAAAPFFHDHFPRRPVFPATLLLDAQIALALETAAEMTHWPMASGAELVPLRMTRVKVRSFTPPGQLLTVAATLQAPAAATARFALTAEADGKRVATAQVEIGQREIA
jgi:3-hydroxymyristoyl/3-hydroxydecanoyl-(acyl carrier protein) dehydratase